VNAKSKRRDLLISLGFLSLGLFSLGLLVASSGLVFAADGHPSSWDYEWQNTDFSRHAVPFDEIMSGGPPKDGIPSIDHPQFVPVSGASGLADTEPVIGLVFGGEAKAYPIRVLTFHEIVNDEIAGIPVAVTFCPLCNSSIVFDRRHQGQVLDFGTTGKLRKSDMVMYDRQTQSWWQQFLGQGIVGELTGVKLGMLPSRLESWANFRERAPEGHVLIPSNPDMRPYGRNPYVGYDSAAYPFLYRGDMPDGIKPMVRVIAVDNEAWAMPMLRDRGQIDTGNLVLSWQGGQNSALDSSSIANGRDVGNITVQRRENGQLTDVIHDVTFAFVFHAFRPDGTIHTQ
jgi:hypothetical protein